MCDQDQFEKDRQDNEARGLVTRRQFGALLGAGMAILLPQVANAVAVTESGRQRDHARWHRRLLFRIPSKRFCCRRARVADIFGLRPAFRQMGKRLAESGYAVLVVNPFYRVKKAPTAGSRCQDSDRRRAPACAGSQRDHTHDRCEGIHRVVGPSILGRKEPEGGHAGVLHGRPNCVSHRGGNDRSRRRGRLVSWRRVGHRHAEQSASSGREDQGAFLDRNRGKRRQAVAR